MSIKGVPKLSEGIRKTDKELTSAVKIAMYIDPETASQLKRIAAAADMKMSKAVSRLVAYAIEKLAAEKKRRAGNHP